MKVFWSKSSIWWMMPVHPVGTDKPAEHAEDAVSFGLRKSRRDKRDPACRFNNPPDSGEESKPEVNDTVVSHCVINRYATVGVLQLKVAEQHLLVIQRTMLRMSIELALTIEEEGEGNYAEVAAGKWHLENETAVSLPWKLLDRSLESAAPRFRLPSLGIGAVHSLYGANFVLVVADILRSWDGNQLSGKVLYNNSVQLICNITSDKLNVLFQTLASKKELQIKIHKLITTFVSNSSLWKPPAHDFDDVSLDLQLMLAGIVPHPSVQPQALVMDLKHPWAVQAKQIDGLLQVGLMIELLEVYQ
ncbi:unnamed protein product [Sphagnum jensenii]|uniref:Uncharacterized protein n=1 Tax=Sphagnum jensenii TaxID=128206 RepID=A0ABP0WYY9_9BRYO